MLGAAQPAGAQDEPTPPAGGPSVEAQAAEARALFALGVEHASAQRWARAIEAFESALALRAAPAILYNLAAALVESGRYRDAHGHLLALEADPETPENLATLGRELRVRMEAEAGRLQIMRDPAIADAEVVLDTLPVPADQLETAIPVRAGEHRVVATRGAAMVATATVTALAGTVTDVRLEPAVEPPPVEVVPAPSTSILETPTFWVLVGAGVLLVVGAIVVTAVLVAESGQGVVPGDFSPAIVSWP